MSKSIEKASLSAVAKAVSENAGGATRQAAVIAAASGLVLSGGLAAQAFSTPEAAPASHTAPASAAPAPSASAEVKAPAAATAKKVERAAVKAAPKKAVKKATKKAAPKRAAAPANARKATTAGAYSYSYSSDSVQQAPARAAVKAAPAQAAAATAPQAASYTAPVAQRAAYQAPAAQPAAYQAPAAQPAAYQAPAAAKPVASTSGVGATIAAAARAQVGMGQDCTMLVTNALAAAGISHHGWPASYMGLGTITSNPQPGDLIYYDNAGSGVPHIAVYIGNGQAVHGGWNGNQTTIASAYLGSGPVFIHVG
ncbi:NlpC/P60 family protein [Falsarthrobacter nasiphocae]|uniref:Cell wall-associated NlpC family hydrolase n=1 Tax=Falsarthrobacter nasiphocae TaxID=189863 RepID=A0AAE3YGY5_9MICC|nr:NlpC/P60 family protein [Falsarthrobacter nasiphocae]MDR6891733.1 cell wall-associated NlpC family hydrolase [Falsarthrobacter nasiphocae]